MLGLQEWIAIQNAPVQAQARFAVDISIHYYGFGCEIKYSSSENLGDK
jgi:hypothetical protein